MLIYILTNHGYYLLTYYLLNGSVEYIVTALDIFFVFTNHLKMAAKQSRNM
jgi:hypothetical protein